MPGLKGNPTETGQIFSDDAPYFSQCQNKEIVEPIAKSIVEFERLRDTKGYKEMEFDWRTGAHKAVHKKHEDHDHDNEQKFFADKVSATQLEKECMNEAYRMGHRAVLLEEGVKGADRNAICCLDLRLDGRIMDIRSITQNGERTILNAIKDKYRSQLKRYNEIHEDKCDTICLYFRERNWYSTEKIESAIDEFMKYYRETGRQPQVRHIICVVKGATDVAEFDVSP